MKRVQKQVMSPIGEIQENVIQTPQGDVFALYRLADLNFPLNNFHFFEEYKEDGKGVFSHDEFDYKLFDVPEGYDMLEHIETTMARITVQKTADMSPYEQETVDIYQQYWRRAGQIVQEELRNSEYTTYLQVRLTKPVEILDPIDFIQAAKRQAVDGLKKVMGRTETMKPLSYYHDMEERLYQDLQNYKALDRVKETEMKRLMYYYFHRANHTPFTKMQVDDFNQEEGILTNHRGYLTIEQLNKTHYISILPLVQAPSSIYGSAFIQQLRDTLAFPFETQVHARFHRLEKDFRDISKIRKRLYWQQEDRNRTDRPLDEDEEVSLEGEGMLKDLKNNLQAGEFRLAQTSLFFIVSADSKEELDSRIKGLQYAIEPTKFRVYQPIVDQLTLFHQTLLATPYTFRLFERQMTTGYLWDLGMDLQPQIGNRYGLPLGRVVTNKKYRTAKEALQHSSKMVWWNPGLTKKGMTGATFTNGNTVFIGPPGLGKSFTIKYVFCWLPSLGQKVLYVDPKDETEDFFQRARKEHSDNLVFQRFVDRINFMRLSGEEKNRGLLDPLLFLKGEEAEMTAREMLEELGEVENDKPTAREQKVLIQRAVKKVLYGDGPKNMKRVIACIRQADEELADHLMGYDTTIGCVLFGDDHSKPINFTNPITVLGLAGLKLPTKEDIKEGKKLTQLQIVSQVIMENVYKLVNIFSTDRSQNAAIIYDEAGGLEATTSGQAKMEDSLRKGRANNTDVYLATQAVGDMADEKKKELISHKFIFRPNDEKAQEASLAFLNLEVNDENKQVIQGLKQGTCLFQDHMGQTQPIAIDGLFQEWITACSSTDKTDILTKNALELEQKRGEVG